MATPICFEPVAFRRQCGRSGLEGTKKGTADRREVGGPVAGIRRLDVRTARDGQLL
ncbi:MAG: hypothetical protein ACKV2Q_15185 [Planctomycetaceae bacterium]